MHQVNTGLGINMGIGGGVAYPVRAPQNLRGGPGMAAAAAGAATAGTGTRDSFLQRRDKLSLAFKDPPAGHRIPGCVGAPGRTHGSWLWELMDVKANGWLLERNSSTAPALAGPLPPIPMAPPPLLPPVVTSTPHARPLTSARALAKTKFY